MTRPPEDNASQRPNEADHETKTPSSNNTNNKSFQHPQRNSLSSLGKWTAQASDFINDNLLLARYTTFATIGLLAVYGVTQTPLFFRYRTVSELPAHYFRRRKTLSCRMIQPIRNSSSEPQKQEATSVIRLHLRHLSPMERILSRSWYEWSLKLHPAVSLGGARREELPRELLTVQLAGIVPPPDYCTSRGEGAGEWWNRLIQNKTTVQCQLLARQLPSDDDSNSHGNSGSSKKRRLNWDDLELPEKTNTKEGQVAIVKLFYRPQTFQLFPTDLGESMVRFGQANPSNDGLYQTTPRQQIVDYSDNHLRKDSLYMDRLSRAEFEAARSAYGMWSDPLVRKSRTDVTDEVDFQTRAPWYRKLYRWLRGR